MVGFGCVTTSEEEFRRGAAEAIADAAELDSLVLRRHGREVSSALCNDMLDRAAEHDGLEAFVLLDEGVSLEQDGFLTVVRMLLAEHDDAALVGRADPSAAHESPVLDGRLAVFSRWAVHELRFDTALEVPLDSAIADVCRQAHARGRRVVTGDLDIASHALCRKLGDRGRLVRGRVAVRRKWDESLV